MNRAFAAVCMSLLLCACVQQVAQDGPPGQPGGGQAPPFPALEAEAVLSKGFQAIFEFSLEDIDLSSFAFEGAKGLGALDPNLVVLRDKDRFQMRLGDETVFAAPMASANDPRGWARLAVEGLIAARGKSQALGEAGAEDVYQAVFDAALARFDLHSRYAGADETKRLRAKRSGVGENGTASSPATVGLRQDDHIALIQIVGFNQQTQAAVESKLREAQATFGRGLKGLILDLRGNPGGVLEQAVRVADLFLGPGRIASARGRHPLSSVNHEATEGDLLSGLPIVVLVDGRTASGAEVLAAALQDRGRAVVVGTATFGKGLVQTVIELPNGGEIDLSWSRLHAPSGYALQGLGVLPNVCTSSGARRSGSAGPFESAATDFAQWRTVGTASAQARRQLRMTCPPEAGAEEAEDTALRLVMDRSLYAKALAPTGAYSGLRP